MGVQERGLSGMGNLYGAGLSGMGNMYGTGLQGLQGFGQQGYGASMGSAQTLADILKQQAQMAHENQLTEKELKYAREVNKYQQQSNLSKVGGMFSGVGKGVLSGAALGSVVPGLGTALGAGIGGLSGFLGGLF